MRTLSCTVLVALFSLLSGCATGGGPIAPKVTKVDYPELNSVRESELGETILSKGITHTFEAIDLRNEIVGGDGLIRERSRLKPQRLIASREDNEWTYFDGKTTYLGQQQPGGLMVSKADRRIVEIWGGSFNRGSKPSPDPIIEFTQVSVEGRASFRQELIYNGRSGSAVRFTYRELSDSLMRPAFSQEASYDLSESRVIGFKGARIEVIEASNTKLKYKVMSSFPSI